MGLHAELDAALESFRVRSRRSFTLMGRVYHGQPNGTGDREAWLCQGAREQLAVVLYHSLHCRIPAAPAASSASDPVAARDMVQRLSLANCGTGPWQSGWVVRRVAPSGWLEVERYGLRWRVPPHQFRKAAEPADGPMRGLVKIGKEFRELSHGFLMVLGDADDNPEETTLRFYWHISADGAEPLVRDVSQTLNGAGIPFRLKLLKAPKAYGRTDAAVLYIPRSSYAPAAPFIPGVWRTVRAHLTPEVSAFAKRLAPGLGAAESPAPSVSFGQHRSQQLADALASRAVAQARSGPERRHALLERLRASGVDPDRPHLVHGSDDVFDPFEP